MRISDSVLFDSNILIYTHNKASFFHRQAFDLVKAVMGGSIKGVLAQQNLLEFYSTITDSRRVEKPLSAKEALSLVEQYLSSPFRIIFPSTETIQATLALGYKQNFKNGKIFDVYLIATMLSNNISSIITVNAKDFKDFPGIKVFDIRSFDTIS